MIFYRKVRKQTVGLILKQWFMVNISKLGICALELSDIRDQEPKKGKKPFFDKFYLNFLHKSSKSVSRQYTKF